MPTRLILDVDTGTDDAVAIMLAALHPDVELLAVTTVNGNAPLEVTTDNTLRVLDHLGVQVPVYAGQSEPLAPRGAPMPGRSTAHGDHLDIPPARSSAQPTPAVDLLIDTFRAATDPVVLVATGPLTNVAAAITIEPRLAGLIPEMVVMGGVHETGAIGPPVEFNVGTDPEAAQIVLTSGVRRLTLVPLDATRQALVSLDDCAALQALGTPAGTATAAFVRRRIRAAGERPATAAPVHDALCVAAVIDRSLVTTRPCYVDVATDGELTTGLTVIDVAGVMRRLPNADVAFDADGRRFVGLLMSTFG